MSRSFEGSVYRTPDGKRWFARLRYTDNGGRSREKKRICRTHAAARKKIAELRAESESERCERKTYRDVDQFYRDNYVHSAKFVGGRTVSGFRQSTDTVKHYMNAALDFFGDRFIDSITYADLQNFKTEIELRPTRHRRRRSISDTNHYLKRLRRLFNVAIEQGWLVSNPFARGSALIKESFEVERTRTLSVGDEQRLLAQCVKWRKHLRPLIVFAIETACRRSEIQKLRWSSVNLQGRYIKIESSTTKTLRPRLVPVTNRLAQTLAELWDNSTRRHSAFVFGPADFKKSFNNAVSDAGLSDLHFHDLRHTGTSRMIQKGIPIAEVMKITGHSQMRTFLRYVNQSENSVYEIAMKLDRAA